MAHVARLRTNSPKQVAALVILVMMAMVLSFVEVPPIASAPYLKYDPSGVIAVLAALIYGPITGTAVAVLAWIPRLVTDPLGAFMNILSSVSLVVVMGSFYRRRPTWGGAVGGALAGTVCSMAVSIFLNFVIMPVYQPVTVADVALLVTPALLPFNAVKCVLNGGIALIAFRKLEALLAEGDAGGVGGAACAEHTDDSVAATPGNEENTEQSFADKPQLRADRFTTHASTSQGLAR